jgi:hypothetical protein
MKKQGRVAAIEQQISDAPIYKKATWIDSCPPDVKRDFEEIKKRFREGKYKTYTRAAVAKAISVELETQTGTRITPGAIERWLVR